MELRTLRYYLAVCEAGSMSRAAERLHVTQPTLSRQISDLERELGCALLVRHSRSVEPTEEGLHLVSRATDIVSLADLTEGEYRDRGKMVAGDIRIAWGVERDRPRCHGCTCVSHAPPSGALLPAQR